VRASNGKSKPARADKIKLSTVVDTGNSEAVEKFYARYAEVCKSGMTELKKRERRKKAKAKKTSAATGAAAAGAGK
jgi:signal recognition particle subunit SRP14